MSAIKLSSMEIDVIGEILNISLGASATAISTMLDARVDITTPVVQVRSKSEFEFSNLEPAVGVEITYVDGLSGNNLMLLKRQDVKVIVEMLMGMEIADEDFELDEMNISAICEVMNQMMGASSTALSELLSKSVNISTPVSFEVENTQQFKDKYFEEDTPMVVIGFTLRISDTLESEFLNLMPVELAKELVAGFFPDGVPEEEGQEAEVVQEPQEVGNSKDKMLNDAAIQALLAGHVEEEREAALIQPEPMLAQPASVPQMQTTPVPQMQTAAVPQMQTSPVPQRTDSMLVQQMQQMQQMMEMMQQQMQLQQKQVQQINREPKRTKVNPAPQPNLYDESDAEYQERNMDLIMGVPLEISVEIGRTRKVVKDILDFNKGTLVVLDKLAGEQVDLYANGQCIAKGDVVVVEDNFGIRITEILQNKLVLEE